MARRFRFVGTPRQLVGYRLVAESMSSVPAHMAHYRLAVLAKHLDPVNGETQPNRARVFGLAHLRNVIEYLEAGDLTGADRHLRQMVAHDPSILLDPGTFYEIGCASQPRGYRGDVATLDLARAERLIAEVLKRLFYAEPLHGGDRHLETGARAAAHFALGKLAYARTDLALARRQVMASAKSNPTMVIRPEFLALALKSLFSRRLLDVLRRRRSAHPNATPMSHSRP
jgi:hypothetical protein